MPNSDECDVIILGAGLAGTLIAARIAEVQPHIEFIILDSQEQLGGIQTWSFHDGDLSSQQHQWVAPFLTRTWPRHEVRFPDFERILPSAYHSIASADFYRHMVPRLGNRLRLNTKVTAVEPHRVTTSTGAVFKGKLIIDSRGLGAHDFTGRAGFQKFLGWDVTLKSPHGLEHAVLMDASLPQSQGFRFCYLLPWSTHRILVEDTSYSLNSNLDIHGLQNDLKNYIAHKNWEIESIDRQEQGVLPIPLTTDFYETTVDSEVIRLGTRGGLFHFTTGYSFSDAVKVAFLLGSTVDLTSKNTRTVIEKYKEQRSFQRGFYLFLNRVLFQAAAPDECLAIFSRFYKQNPDFIRRFYAGKTTTFDKIRLFSGKPPIAAKKILKIIGQAESTPL